MSNTVAIAEKKSQSLVSENGSVIFPKNFDALSVRNQKKAIIEAFRDNLIALNDTITAIERLKEDAKNLAQRIKLSKEGKELARLRKELSALDKQHNDIKSGRSWMLRMAAKLEIDIRAELKNLKLIEGE